MKERNTFNIQFFADDEDKAKDETDKKEDEDKKEEGKQSDAETAKFAEGARKATKQLLSELGFSSVEEAKAALGKKDTDKSKTETEKTPSDDNQLSILAAEVKAMKAEKVVDDLGVKKEYKEDLIALLKGKGLEINEKNLKTELDKHAEWKINADTSGTQPLGTTKGKSEPSSADEEAKAKALFGL